MRSKAEHGEVAAQRDNAAADGGVVSNSRPACNNANPVVTTSSGRARGETVAGVRRFYALPYAAAPVDESRFKNPVPRPSWRGERDATKRGPNAPQSRREFPAIDMTPVVGDGWRKGGCFLTANVWTPVFAARRLPVMVFIHGGAWIGGAADCSAYDGTSFARNGVVLITVSYRLGIEGVLPIPGADTNLCLRDMIAALEWVKANAESFGGDPGNVTVFGESAGAMSIGNLVTSPLAKGLFRRAILQSGHGSMLNSRQTAGILVDALAGILGVEPSLEGFRSKSTKECIVAAEVAMQPGSGIDLREPGGKDPTMGLSKFKPLVGDDVVPELSVDALGKGAGRDVEILIGSCLEEMNIYLAPTGILEMDDPAMMISMLARVQPNAADVLAAYGLDRDRPGVVLARAMSDLAFRDPVRHYALAHQGRTHVYEFGWRSPALGGRLGACHALELPFVFNTLATCTGSRGLVGENPPQGLADHIHQIWIQFAKDGSLPWEPFNADTRQVYRLDKQSAAHEPEMPASRFR